MALVVQVNQSPTAAGANSYITVAEFKTYHDLRLNDYSAYTDPQITAALVKACQYLDMRFNFVGWRVESGQTTEWPRNGAFDDRGDIVTGVPQQVKDAQAEYALRALGADLLADPAQDETGRRVKSKSEKVGPVSESVEYDANSVNTMPSYPFADKLILGRGLAIGASSSGIGGGTLGRA